MIDNYNYDTLGHIIKLRRNTKDQIRGNHEYLNIQVQFDSRLKSHDLRISFMLMSLTCIPYVEVGMG